MSELLNRSAPRPRTNAADRARHPVPDNAHDRAVGERLRLLRKQKQVSLQALGAATGLSIGYISQIERGISSASVRVLAVLCDKLGFGLDAVFQSPQSASSEPGQFAFRISERQGLGFWRDGIEKDLLTPGEGMVLKMFLVTISPAGHSGESAYSHAGEEAGFVLEGRLSLIVDGVERELAEGEAFRFRSHRPHRFGNAGDRECRVLWINAPSLGTN